MVEAKANLREGVYTEFPEVGDGVCGIYYSCHDLETGHGCAAESWREARVGSKEVAEPL